jgi:predicted Zn finger-like uncharacterized protein
MLLITCSGCNSKIRVPDSAAGKRVKCPKCATLIPIPEAEKTQESAQPEAEPQEAPQESPDPDAFSTTPSSSGSKPPPIKKQRASWLDEDGDEEEDDDEPKPPPKRRREYDDDDDDPPRKSRKRKDRDEDYDIAKDRDIKPHRGTLVLILGLIGLIGGLVFFFPAVLGIVAWVMGHSDLREMKSGRMDTEGESNTYVGYILGIISTVIGGVWLIAALVSIVIPTMIGLGFFGLCAGCACCGAAAAPPNKGGPPRRNF